MSKEELIDLVEQLMAGVARMEALEERVQQLEQRNAELEAELGKFRKNSSTSSKPPSSDIVKPPNRRGTKRKGKRKAGDQPGHAKHERPPFTPDQLDGTWDYTLSACPDCGGDLKNAQVAPRVVQQVELVQKSVRIDEHRAHAFRCPRCHQVHFATLPDEVAQGGLVGLRLTAHIGYLK